MSSDESDDGRVDFFDIPMEGIEETDELSDYLSSPLEKVRDPIAWWWTHRDVYPTLSKMAFDYLSIPGQSNIPPLRVFNASDRIIF